MADVIAQATTSKDVTSQLTTPASTRLNAAKKSPKVVPLDEIRRPRRSSRSSKRSECTDKEGSPKKSKGGGQRPARSPASPGTRATSGSGASKDGDGTRVTPPGVTIDGLKGHASAMIGVYKDNVNSQIALIIDTIRERVTSHLTDGLLANLIDACIDPDDKKKLKEALLRFPRSQEDIAEVRAGLQSFFSPHVAAVCSRVVSETTAAAVNAQAVVVDGGRAMDQATKPPKTARNQQARTGSISSGSAPQSPTTPTCPGMAPGSPTRSSLVSPAAWAISAVTSEAINKRRMPSTVSLEEIDAAVARCLDLVESVSEERFRVRRDFVVSDCRRRVDNSAALSKATERRLELALLGDKAGKEHKSIWSAEADETGRSRRGSRRRSGATVKTPARGTDTLQLDFFQFGANSEALELFGSEKALSSTPMKGNRDLPGPSAEAAHATESTEVASQELQRRYRMLKQELDATADNAGKLYTEVQTLEKEIELTRSVKDQELAALRANMQAKLDAANQQAAEEQTELSERIDELEAALVRVRVERDETRETAYRLDCICERLNLEVGLFLHHVIQADVYDEGVARVQLQLLNARYTGRTTTPLCVDGGWPKGEAPVTVPPSQASSPYSQLPPAPRTVGGAEGAVGEPRRPVGGGSTTQTPTTAQRADRATSRQSSPGRDGGVSTGGPTVLKNLPTKAMEEQAMVLRTAQVLAETKTELSKARKQIKSLESAVETLRKEKIAMIARAAADVRVMMLRCSENEGKHLKRIEELKEQLSRYRAHELEIADEYDRKEKAMMKRVHTSTTYVVRPTSATQSARSEKSTRDSLPSRPQTARSSRSEIRGKTDVNGEAVGVGETMDAKLGSNAHSGEDYRAGDRPTVEMVALDGVVDDQEGLVVAAKALPHHHAPPHAAQLRAAFSSIRGKVNEGTHCRYTTERHRVRRPWSAGGSKKATPSPATQPQHSKPPGAATGAGPALGKQHLAPHPPMQQVDGVCGHTATLATRDNNNSSNNNSNTREEKEERARQSGRVNIPVSAVVAASISAPSADGERHAVSHVRYEQRWKNSSGVIRRIPTTAKE